MKILTIIQWLARIAGVAALILGLADWIFQIELVSIHMLCGILLCLSLLILAVASLVRKSAPVLGAISIIYALVVPVFGIMQLTLLTGDLHWLIRSLHLLIGLGALTLVQLLGTRLQSRKSLSDGIAQTQNADMRR